MPLSDLFRTIPSGIDSPAPAKRQPLRGGALLRRALLGTALIPLPLDALAEVPRVLVDTPALHSIAASVMAGAGTPDLLLPPGASPHDFALRPSDAAALAEADLIFWVGAGLTPWLADPLEALGEGATRISLLDSPGWPALALRGWDDGHDHGHDHGEAAAKDAAHDDHDHADEHAEDGHDDHEGHDHAEAAHDDHDEHDHAAEAHSDEHADHDDHAEEHSDDHAGHDHGDAAQGDPDPHAWLDPQVANAWALTIAEALGAKDPDNAGLYLQNAAALAAANEALIREVTDQLAPHAGKGFIVPHDAFQYFEARFGMPASGTISLSDAQTPTPTALAALRDRTESEAIGCILTDPQTNPAWAGIVADGTGAKLVSADAEGTTLTPGPELYAALVRSVADALDTCLSPA
jgi:zinc transport system substrate-binding protein